MTICYIHFFKIVRDVASFPSTERPFQVLVPLKEQHFWPVFELFLGNLKSVSVFFKHLRWSSYVRIFTVYLLESFWLATSCEVSICSNYKVAIYTFDFISVDPESIGVEVGGGTGGGGLALKWRGRSITTFRSQLGNKRHKYHLKIPRKQMWHQGRAIAPFGRGEKLFIRRFLAFIVPWKPCFTPLIGRVGPPSENSWHQPCKKTFRIDLF